MKGEKLLVTMKDIKRYKVLKDVIEKRLKGTEAAQLLYLSVFHVDIHQGVRVFGNQRGDVMVLGAESRLGPST